MPVRRDRYALSLSAGGRLSGRDNRIAAGIASSISASSVGAPTVASISSRCRGVGPMWRAGKVSEAVSGAGIVTVIWPGVSGASGEEPFIGLGIEERARLGRRGDAQLHDPGRV